MISLSLKKELATVLSERNLEDLGSHLQLETAVDKSFEPRFVLTSISGGSKHLLGGGSTEAQAFRSAIDNLRTEVGPLNLGSMESIH